MTNLAGKTTLITGASQGIGAATAKHFASLGARVVLVARSADKLAALAEETGGLALPCDVADFSALSTAVATAARETGGVDVLVNNAGVIDPVARIAESDPDAWGRVVDINLKGVYHGLRAVLPGMLSRGAGTILNLSSGAATGALEGWSHYCATKAAVLSLTRVAHKEYGDKGIRVMGLSPGTVETEMQVQIRDSGINPVSQLSADAHISPKEAAQALAYLCTPAADAHLGTDFSIKTPEGRAEAGLPPRP
ncbi:MAG: SDR family oxidoreductase [Dinoroseobacter sp.]|nr:SDR family oxidoreductase [Dinoroseobacter sp.]